MCKNNAEAHVPGVEWGREKIIGGEDRVKKETDYLEPY